LHLGLVCFTASTMNELPLRGQRLAESLSSETLDALLITNPVNVTYLTGFSGESSYLIVARDRTLLVSDGRFTQQLAEECPDLELHIRPPAQSIQDAAAQVLSQLGLRNVGFESAHLTVADFETLAKAAPAISWKPGRDRVERLRLVKDATEIAQIREAIHMAERAFAMFRAMLRTADSEKDLADALEGYIRRAGGKCASFPSIVAVGPRAALPHAPPTKKAVAEAELLLVDWGASGAFYKSDLTRVLVPRKNPSRSGSDTGQLDPRLRDVYGVVLKAQEQAIRTVRAGLKAGDVDNAARSVIADAGYGEYFNHGLGHGIGLMIHEAPFMKPGAEIVLQAGMVVTIEPGIYLPDWGGVRIEDDVLITPDGCEVLSGVPKRLEAMVVDL
jgi:Xaa-Pro aminopeptidase